MGGLVQQSATSRSLRRQATDRVRGPVRAGRPDQSGRLRLNQRASAEPGAVQVAWKVGKVDWKVDWKVLSCWCGGRSVSVEALKGGAVHLTVELLRTVDGRLEGVVT